MAAQSDKLSRSYLPMPNTGKKGLITFDALFQFVQAGSILDLTNVTGFRPRSL